MFAFIAAFFTREQRIFYLPYMYTPGAESFRFIVLITVVDPNDSAYTQCRPHTYSPVPWTYTLGQIFLDVAQASHRQHPLPIATLILVVTW